MSVPKRSVEDAPLNAFHRKLTVYSAGGPFLDGYVLSIIGVAMLQITQALQLSAFWEGLIAASALIGVFLGGFLGGWFTDKYGRKVLYLVDLIAIVGFSVAQFWVESAWALFAWRLLIGIAVGADYPIATSLLAEFLPRKQRGPLLAAMVLMWFAGAAVAYVVGELLLRVGGDDGWRWVLASALVPGALFLIARSGTPESPRWLLSKGRTAEADAVIKRVYGPDYSIADLPEHVSGKPVSVWSLFHSGYGKRMAFVTLFWTCAIVPLFAIYAFAPKVLQALKLTGDWAAYGSIAITLLFTLGCLLATKLINRLGRRKMLIHSFLWSGMSLVLLGVFPDASPTTVLVLFGAYAVLIGGAQVLEYVYPNELFPTEIRASAVGLATSLSRIGAAVGTYLVPISLATYGIANTMFAAALISLFGALISWWLAPETSKLDLQQAAALGGAAPAPSPSYKTVARKA
ncbi:MULTISPECIES: MFS transporter [unclassified Pseudomonas]|uniref:MFS transporter n=1 Tax=unclassified Pseudomonas TaxID=196821 RepID=UPI000418241F|nr:MULTISPECIES: MFS transporter [unclassified Pseudomonas]ATP49737.1 MFS transporter [Pseudomonas putida]MCX2683950.1 MFS transporter [Pseudomonas sp. DCB_AW]MDE4538136.1 MFS transporter [Pseudomonas sp. ITEM 17296]SMF32692.1 MFS transporter, putative metabolite transport protein [Pseudomonas sp. LAIL14HWK12:I11]SMR77974.1 MFS transporter, putative metabolite transport protein [Pseudomonas sp. LAIL14HWK12:I10]